MVKRSFILAVIVLILIGQPVGAATSVLFDATLQSTPDAQGWLYASFPLRGVRATKSFDGATAILDTTAARGDMAGYFSTRLPTTLDRKRGFQLLFTLQIIEEKHVSADRAGFSLILLSSDLKGVELAFWEDQIWTQADEPLFTRGEGSRPFNTWSRPVNYVLTIDALTYTLSADGKAVLSGTLKDYSAFNTPPFDFIYRQPNFIFFGDNTGSAAARVAIGSILLQVPSDEPPPTAAGRGPTP